MEASDSSAPNEADAISGEAGLRRDLGRVTGLAAERAQNAAIEQDHYEA